MSAHHCCRCAAVASHGHCIRVADTDPARQRARALMMIAFSIAIILCNASFSARHSYLGIWVPCASATSIESNDFREKNKKKLVKIACARSLIFISVVPSMRRMK